MSAATYARCPNPAIYLEKATNKHLQRNTGRDQSVICASDFKDPRLYTYGVLPMQDLDAQEKAKPGMPIFNRRFGAQAMFESSTGRGLFNPVKASELKAITRDWINYDKGVKRKKTMQARIESWTKTKPVVKYKHETGFAQAPCFDPAPYNETGFPMCPRMMSKSSAMKAGYANKRVFTQPFNIPNEMQHAVGLGGHEEDSYHTKSQHGFGDYNSAIPHIEFMKEAPKPRGVTQEKPNFATALLPPPRFLQTSKIMSPRKRRELIAVYDEDGDGQMDSEELAAAPTHVREFMARNKIGPESPATKHLPRGALTFCATGPLVTPRRTHHLAHDSHLFSGEDIQAYCSRKGSQTARQVESEDLNRTLTLAVPLTSRTGGNSDTGDSVIRNDGIQEAWSNTPDQAMRDLPKVREPQ